MTRKLMLALRLAGQDLRGNIAVHAAALLIITAAFLTVGVFALTAANLQALAGHWEAKVRLCVYLFPDAPESGHPAIRERLEEMPGTASVEYVSRERALADFREMLGDEAGLLDGLDENPLPAGFTVSLAPGAREAGAVSELAALIGSWPEVEEVVYGGEWLAGFQSALGLARAGVIALGALVAAAAVFIISNAIRLSMYSRKDEIGIMRLVGAPALLVRLPFVLEGVFQGAGAAALSLGALYLLFRLFISGAAWPGALSGFDPVFPGAAACLLFAGAGAVLGAAASVTRFSRFART